MAAAGIIATVAADGVTMTGSPKDCVDDACKRRPPDARTNGQPDDRVVVDAADAAAAIAET
jgi:hypothetical protein